MTNKENVLKKISIGEVKTQSDILADKIKNMIIAGELKEGYQFPNENEFCSLLNVGRGTLREAYKILDTQGYIKRTKQGTYVRQKADVAKDGNFLASLELADSQEMIEFVWALEPAAVYLAAKQITKEQIEQVEKMMEQCRRYRHDGRVLSSTNYDLHKYIRNLSGNPVIISALTAYYRIFCRQVIQPVYSYSDTEGEFIDKTLKQHEELLYALKSHDGDRAREITCEHLLTDWQYRQVAVSSRIQQMVET